MGNIENYLKRNANRDKKIAVILFDGEVTCGYSGKVIYASKRSASQSLSYLVQRSRQDKEELEKLKEEGRVVIKEIDLNDLVISEEEIIQKYLDNALKNV